MKSPEVAGRSGVWALAAAAVAALLASSCCLMPLLLVSVGFSAGWLASLRALEPFSAVLTVVAVGALLIAGWSLFRSPAACAVTKPRSVPPLPGHERPNLKRPISFYYKALFWAVALLTLALIVVPLLAPWFY